jgi:chromosomal replication initiator protein
MFDKKYTFENFVVGGGNEFAYSICTAISKNPGINYNPLFLWGNVGLGKTHLLQATANSIINRFPDKTVLYLPTTKFIDELVDSIRKNKLNAFIKKFDSVDVLMLDDIQFLANKEKTQEILHNLFNEFVSKNKQIIISSDRPPKQLPTIEDRLRSRFGQGMITDVSMPDAETRIAIITNYLKARNVVLSQNISIEHEIIEIIANSMDDNIREIE